MKTERIIPYFNLYATDFKAIKDKLTPKQVYAIIDALCDLCMFGSTNYTPDNHFSELYYNKLIDGLNVAKKRYFSSVENGKKGGRPLKNKNPQDNLPDNPQVNLDYNLNEKQTKTKTKIKTKTKQNNNYYGELKNVCLTEEQYNKLSDKFFNLDAAIEVLDTWLGGTTKAAIQARKGNHYAYFKSNSWVWERVAGAGKTIKPKMTLAEEIDEHNLKNLERLYGGCI